MQQVRKGVSDQFFHVFYQFINNNGSRVWMLCLMCCLALYPFFSPLSNPSHNFSYPVSSSCRNNTENEGCSIAVLTVYKHLVCPGSFLSLVCPSEMLETLRLPSHHKLLINFQDFSSCQGSFISIVCWILLNCINQSSDICILLYMWIYWVIVFGMLK